MNMNFARKRSAIVILITILVIVWFYPKKYSNCHGVFRCYGCIVRNSKEQVMLNASRAVLEIEKEPRNICLGFNLQKSMMFDACNGSWGWFNKRPVDCEKILQRCHGGDLMPFGIECKEWKRACDELSRNTVVPLKIKDYRETGIVVNCEHRDASFPGGETEFVKFLNSNFRYPDLLKGKRVDGSLNIGFLLDTTGCLNKVFFREPEVYEYYKAESRRVLGMMPLWSPGFCDQRKIESAVGYIFHFSNTDSTYKNIAIKISKTY